MTTESSTVDPSRRLVSVLVTHRRPEALAETLRAVAAQTVRPARLVVVDNCPAEPNRETVRRTMPGAEYVAAPENLGPAGGIALGMERVLVGAHDDDWLVTLDDDDPPTDPALFEQLLDLGCAMRAAAVSVGGVGVSGVRFDRSRGQIVRVPDDELDSAVPVDAIAGNQFPCYSVRAVRAVGTFRRDLFFGFEELEFGLRLRDAGFTLYGHGPIWYARRREEGRLAQVFAPSRSLGAVSWRRYYSLRNLVRILCDFGEHRAALRVAFLAGIAKPLVNVMREPLLAGRHLLLNLRALRDACTHRLGRTLEPDR